jgi:hypothetical protein
MDQCITEFQKRRADNIIWNCAGDYSFAPDFKAYDSSGGADIYWNIIFGSARRRYEYEKLEALFSMLDKYRDAALTRTYSGARSNRCCFGRSSASAPCSRGSGPRPRRRNCASTPA